MVINGNVLLAHAPIVNMEKTKIIKNGFSYGLGEAGYDIRVAQEIAFDPGYPTTYPTVTCGEEESHMGRFIIASAIEEFNMPNNLVGIVHDKSTWARQGISVFNTVIEPGWRGFLTLEIVFHGNKPIYIETGTPIAQVIFHKLSDEASYNGKYQDQENKPVKPILEV